VFTWSSTSPAETADLEENFATTQYVLRGSL
jgi:hypothetical protein